MPFQFKPRPRVFPDQPVWGALACGYTFIITHDDDAFTASAKAVGAKPFDATRHDLGKHPSFDAAQQACVDFAYRRQS